MGPCALHPRGRLQSQKQIQEQAGLLPCTDVDFIYDGENIRAVAAKSLEKESRGEAVIRLLKRSAAVAMSTDEIMALTRGE